MPKRTRVTDAVFARGVSHLADDINAIRDQHKIEPADLIRGLLEGACQFYRTHGWFSFPVKIEPEAFQAKYVAEREQAAYAEKELRRLVKRKSSGDGGGR